MGSEKFCLRWNDFESNISVAFRELRDDKDFFDVTLACDDDQIQAHKVILSACSPFFRSVLRRNPHQHPLLYLKGVKYTDLQSVLNFMYHGEVNVAQDELNSFLAVAEDLRVKGLTQNQSGGASGKSSATPAASSYTSSVPKSPAAPKSASRAPDRDTAPPPKRPRPLPVNNIAAASGHEDDDIQEVVPVKSEPRDTNSAGGGGGSGGVVAPTDMYASPAQSGQSHALAQEDDLSYGQDESYDDYEQYGGEGYDGTMMDPALAGAGGDGNKGNLANPEDLFQFVEKDKSTGGYICTICTKTQATRRDVRNHVESIHFPNLFQYECRVCGRTLKTKKSLDWHMTSLHRDHHGGHTAKNNSKS